ncbi:hypothetical protein A7P97_03470 [Eikenella sp. NML070372]|nr:hypothetical protein A7P97_03470 [Eikenella sp. NML070372]
MNKVFYLKHQYCVDMNIEFINGRRKLYGEDFDKGNYTYNEYVDDMQKNFSGLSKLARNKIYLYKFKVIAYDSRNIEILNKEYMNTDNAWTYGVVLIKAITKIVLLLLYLIVLPYQKEDINLLL